MRGRMKSGWRLDGKKKEFETQNLIKKFDKI